MTFHRLNLPGDVVLNVIGSTTLEAIADNYAVNVARITKAYADADTARDDDEPYLIKLRTGEFSSTAVYEMPLTHLYEYAKGLSLYEKKATKITLPDGTMLTVTGKTTFEEFADDYFAKIQKSPAIAALRAQRQNVVDEAVLGIQHAAKRVCPFDQTDESLKPVAEALLSYMKLISRNPAHMDRSGIVMKKDKVGAMLESMTRECTQQPGAILGTELNLMGEKLKTGHTIGPRDIKIMTDALQAHQITQQPSRAAVMHGLRL